MNLKNMWNKYVEKYMKNSSESIAPTEFPVDDIRRYRIVFWGLVQGVGFRYETWSIAQKLELTGFVENLPDGSVYAEIQGPKKRILYLIECLKSVPRIHIDKMEIDEMEVKEESVFEIAN